MLNAVFDIWTRLLQHAVRRLHKNYIYCQFGWVKTPVQLQITYLTLRIRRLNRSHCDCRYGSLQSVYFRVDIDIWFIPVLRTSKRDLNIPVRTSGEKRFPHGPSSDRDTWILNSDPFGNHDTEHHRPMQQFPNASQRLILQQNVPIYLFTPVLSFGANRPIDLTLILRHRHHSLSTVTNSSSMVVMAYFQDRFWKLFILVQRRTTDNQSLPLRASNYLRRHFNCQSPRTRYRPSMCKWIAFVGSHFMSLISGKGNGLRVRYRNHS